MTTSSPSEPLLEVGPLVKAVGVGIGLSLILVCIVAVAALTGGGAIIAMIQDPSQLTQEAAAGALGGVLALVCLLLCLEAVFTIMTGAGYSFFHKRAKGSVDFGKGAIGGAAATAILAIVGWAFGLCGNLVMFMSGPSLSQQLGLPQTTTGASDVVGILVGSIINLVWTGVLGAVLGAVGGVIYAAIAGKPATQTPAV